LSSRTRTGQLPNHGKAAGAMSHSFFYVAECRPSIFVLQTIFPGDVQQLFAWLIIFSKSALTHTFVIFSAF
jgi:hypothetical protein